MALKIQSVLEYGIPQSADVLNLGFSDYFVPIQLDPSQFHTMLRANQIDVSLSKIAFQETNPIGVALIARRGWTCRLAGMSIIPQARGKGVGNWLMEKLINEARIRGDRTMELEVIRENEGAVKLYQKMGFQSIRKLASYSLESPTGKAGDLEEIDIRTLANLVNTNGYPSLPWQLSGETIAVSGPPNRAFRLESAYAAITNPDADKIVFQSLLTLPQHRSQGQATRLIKALFARFPGKTWAFPGIIPEEMESFLTKIGFELETLGQYQMILNLAGNSA